MSKFSTTIPTAVDETIQSLPSGAILNHIRLSDDPRGVVLEWEHEDFRTPFTGPIEVAPACLAGKQPWPACVRRRAPVESLNRDSLNRKDRGDRKKRDA